MQMILHLVIVMVKCKSSILSSCILILCILFLIINNSIINNNNHSVEHNEFLQFDISSHKQDNSVLHIKQHLFVSLLVQNLVSEVILEAHILKPYISKHESSYKNQTSFTRICTDNHSFNIFNNYSLFIRFNNITLRIMINESSEGI